MRRRPERTAGAMRDLTQAQFENALKRNGMKREMFGYVHVAEQSSVYPRNAGRNRRAQLAYLLRERERILTREAQTPAKGS